MSMEASEYAVDEANAERLTSWLNAGLWTRKEATLLLLEIDPDRVNGDCFSTFSKHGEVQYEYLDDEDPRSRMQYGVDEEGDPDYLSAAQEALLKITKKLIRQIERKINLYESEEPRVWIELACQKGIKIPWLDWAIKRVPSIQSQEPDAVSNVPVVAGAESDTTQWHLLATPEQLIVAFGYFAGMKKTWFNALKDKPQLKVARHMPGDGGKSSRAPLFYVFPVMQWLIDPKRRTGKEMPVHTGWRLLRGHFPKVYEHYEYLAPDPIDRG